MDKQLLAPDIISGQEGTAIANIDGRVRELFEVKNLAATITKKKSAVRTLGKRGDQHKSSGWSGSGSMTYFNVTSEWVGLITRYIKTGVDVYFDMIIINEDPSSNAGRQEVTLYRCNINNLDVAKLDVDADYLDVSCNFTFEDCDLQQSFLEL